MVKTKDRSNKRLIWCHVFIIHLSHIFLIWPLLEAREEIQKYFRWFLVQVRTFKSAFEINWPFNLIRDRGKPTKTHVLTFWYVMVLFMKNNGIKLIRCCTVNCMYYCETIWWLCTSDSFTPFIWHIIRQTFSILPW